jgi:hypothetical protein
MARGLFAISFVAYAWFFGGGGWNQNANFDLTRAIVERGTFAIDAYRDNTYDVSFHGNHVYANKAPGLSLLACVPYGIVYALERAMGIDVDSFAATTINMYLCTVAVCALSGALLVALVFLYARRRVGASRSAALAVALIVAFGTYVFAYSTVFFAHVPAALLLFWSFSSMDKPWLSAGLGGGAVLCNYTSFPALTVIVLAGIFLSGAAMRMRAALGYLLGGLPFAIVLLAYQAICFGSPFRTAVEATSGVFQTRGALFGVFGTPSLDALIGITISRHRGLFFLSPVLVFAFAGTVVMLRRRTMGRELAVVAGVFLAFLLVNISFNNWEGGSAIGPRYMLPVVPFLAVPMLFATGGMHALWVALSAISFVFNFAVVAVNPLPSRTIRDPIFDYALPLLITGHPPGHTPAYPPLAWKQMLGHVSVNRHSADEFAPFVKHPPGSPEAEWASFNLGELIAPGTVMSLLPILIWILGGAAVLRRWSNA